MLALVVHSKNQRYALPCENVREVIARVPLDPIPRAPAHLAGVFNHRGSVTTVIDLSVLLCDAPSAARLSTRIIVLEHRERLALLAERVTHTARIESAGQSLTAACSAHFTSRVVVDDAGMLPILDLEQVLGAVLREPEIASRHVA